jgi:hypothetical protein
MAETARHYATALLVAEDMADVMDESAAGLLEAQFQHSS